VGIDRREKRRPTMKDVAKLAGVSQSSVSLVLNRTTGARISEETQRRVRETAKQLGYQLVARGHAPSDVPPAGCNVVGYIVDEISTTPRPIVTIDGAREAAWEHGCVLSIFATRGDADLEAAALRALLAQPALVGVIYSSIFTRRVEMPALLSGVPTVLLNCYTADGALPSVVPGEVAGGHTATERLLREGHRRIGLINGEPWMDGARDRLKGYRQALATADLPFDPTLVRDGDWMPTSGYEHARSLMREPRPPTALFCANDLMALGALEALKEMGLSVPADVSLIGYDDQEMAQHTRPALTSILLPNAEMGRWAAECLVAEVIHGRPVRPRHVKMDCPLVERDSVGPIRAAPARRGHATARTVGATR
jgi:LacI family transcriptional regulator